MFNDELLDLLLELEESENVTKIVEVAKLCVRKMIYLNLALASLDKDVKMSPDIFYSMVNIEVRRLFNVAVSKCDGDITKVYRYMSYPDCLPFVDKNKTKLSHRIYTPDELKSICTRCTNASIALAMLCGGKSTSDILVTLNNREVS